jgi:hypothetical protein
MREGFIKGDYAAIPYGKKQLMIIHNGHQLEVVNTPLQAQKFIKKHSASQSSGTLPVD